MIFLRLVGQDNRYRPKSAPYDNVGRTYTGMALLKCIQHDSSGVHAGITLLASAPEQ
jgi:hypothetical protein